jgi:DNA adenine methylase
MSNLSSAVKPVAPYIGGKRSLAAELVRRIQAVPHGLYAEPFVGMAGVFLRRDVPARVEVINDLSRDVATLFRILQRHYPQFMDVLKWQLTSRAHFQSLKDANPDTLTDLERSARFLALQRMAFAGKVNGRNFGVSRTNGGRFNVTTLEPLLEAVHERLAGVIIECLPYEKFIQCYDCAHALFYLDPPYYGCETDYGREMFSRDDFERLAGILAGLKGRFILSLNDHAEVRRLFQGFRIEAVQARYTVAGSTKARMAGEVIISNVEGCWT